MPIPVLQQLIIIFHLRLDIQIAIVLFIVVGIAVVAIAAVAVVADIAVVAAVKPKN